MVEKQSKKFIVHFCFHFKAYISVYPAYLWSLRWVYAVKKTQRLVYGVYPQYTTAYKTERIEVLLEVETPGDRRNIVLDGRTMFPTDLMLSSSNYFGHLFT